MAVAPSDRLARRLGLRLALAVALAGVCLLLLWGWIGQRALVREHEAASLRMAALFEVSLHNAMLVRDLAGLQRLLEAVGRSDGLEDAALLHPSGEVRFAAHAQRVARREADALAGLCLGPGCGQPSAPQLSWRPGAGEQHLRVVYPVRNQARCVGCHGSVAAQPVNGVLLLDFAPMASGLAARQQAGTWLLPAALAALLGLAAAVAWWLRRDVVRPLQRLTAAADRLGRGELAARSGLGGRDEIARLGQAFDRMGTQIEQQVRALATQGRFLQHLLDALPDAVLLIGDDHRIVMANAAYGRLLGHDPAGLVGQPCHRASRGRDEPCPVTLVDCPLAHCRQGRPAPRTVMAFAHADGSAVNVEIVAAPLRTPAGQLQVIEVIRPLDDQLRFSQEQRLASIGLLANGVAHEIHNPLASIRLALQASLRGLRDGSMDSAELMTYLGLVDEQIDRCVHITQRLLRLSQPADGPSQPVELAPAVDDVRMLLGEELQRAGVACSVRIEPPGLRILGDAGELRQVLVNLLQNALHAMPGGGTITIEAQRLPGDGAARVRLAVSDTGCGMAADMLPLIFLPFYSRRSDGRAGTGLGLAICKAQIESRGGRIRVDSRPGQGSRFEIEWLGAGLASAADGPRMAG